MKREFTGYDMTKILVAGFGVVVCVNFLMASFAVSGFGGVIVENTYVASQKFNGWLEEAERSKALGWDAELARTEDGHLHLSTTGTPVDLVPSAALRRPLGEKAFADLTFVPTDTPGEFISTEALESGRWTARLTMVSGDNRWSEEIAIP